MPRANSMIIEPIMICTDVINEVMIFAIIIILLRPFKGFWKYPPQEKSSLENCPQENDSFKSVLRSKIQNNDP